MKNPSFLFLLLPACLSAQAPLSQHELYLGKTLVDIRWLAPVLEDIILIGFAEPIKTLFYNGLVDHWKSTDISGRGTLTAGWLATLSQNPKHALGLEVQQTHYAIERTYESGRIIPSTHDWLTLMGRWRYYWKRSDYENLYSGLSAGITSFTAVDSNTLGQDEKFTHTGFAAHLNFLGGSIGDRFGVFFELGIGFNGLLHLGLFTRF